VQLGDFSKHRTIKGGWDGGGYGDEIVIIQAGDEIMIIQAGDEIVIIQARVVVAGRQMIALCWIPASSWNGQYRCMFVPHSSKRKGTNGNTSMPISKDFYSTLLL